MLAFRTTKGAGLETSSPLFGGKNLDRGGTSGLRRRPYAQNPLSIRVVSAGSNGLLRQFGNDAWLGAVGCPAFEQRGYKSG